MPGFFKGAIKANEGDANLSREAKKQLESFKALFDHFSAYNQGANAYGGNAEGESKRYSFVEDKTSYFISFQVISKESKIMQKCD